MNLKKILSLALALIMVFALVACGGNSSGASTDNSAASSGSGESAASAGTAEDNPVAVDKWVIPVLSARTGPISYVGEPAIWGAQYAAEVINAEGGIRGVPVEVVPYDTEFDAQVGAQIAAGLVDDALFMVGCMAAPVSQAISTIVADAKMPNVGSYSYPEIRLENAPYLCGYMSDSEAGDLAAATQWIKDNGFKSIVLFYTPSDTSQAATYATFEANLAAESGAEMVGTVEVETGTLDCGPAAVQGLGYNADAYFICLRADEAGKVIN